MSKRSSAGTTSSRISRACSALRTPDPHGSLRDARLPRGTRAPPALCARVPRRARRSRHPAVGLPSAADPSTSFRVLRLFRTRVQTRRGRTAARDRARVHTGGGRARTVRRDGWLLACVALYDATAGDGGRVGRAEWEVSVLIDELGFRAPVAVPLHPVDPERLRTRAALVARLARRGRFAGCVRRLGGGARRQVCRPRSSCSASADGAIVIGP